MTLLALDLGSDMGYAATHGDGFISGFVAFAPQKTRQFEGGGMRYLRFRRWLDELHKNARIEEIVFEEVRKHIAVAAAHAYGGFLATLSSWCEDHGVPYSGVPVQAIKVYATGKRSAKKELMVAICRQRWKADVTNDDEADAIALLHYKLSELLS